MSDTYCHHPPTLTNKSFAVKSWCSGILFESDPCCYMVKEVRPTTCCYSSVLANVFPIHHLVSKITCKSRLNAWQNLFQFVCFCIVTISLFTEPCATEINLELEPKWHHCQKTNKQTKNSWKREAIWPQTAGQKPHVEELIIELTVTDLKPHCCP